jgi:hypothetical protein
MNDSQITEESDLPTFENLQLERKLIERNLLGDVDPNKMAEQVAADMGLGRIAYGQLATALAHAIIAGFDVASARAVKRLTMLQECETVIDGIHVSPDMKRRARATKYALLDRRDKDLQLVDSRELAAGLAVLDSVNEKFGQVQAQLTRATRALERAGFKDNGAQEWEPPINERAGELQRQVFELQGQLARARAAHESIAYKEHRELIERSGLADPDVMTERLECFMAQADEKALQQNKPPLRFEMPLNDDPPDEWARKVLGNTEWALNYGQNREQKPDQVAQDIAEVESVRKELEGKPYVMILHADPGVDLVRELKGESPAGILNAEGNRIVYESTPCGPDQSMWLDMLAVKGGMFADAPPKVVIDAKDESQSTEQYEGPERRGVHIPGAVWPDPKNAQFSMERPRDPMNAANRHLELKRRRDD